MPPLRSLALASMLLAVTVASALAAWPNQPSLSLPVCTAVGVQAGEQMISDGAGGAILCWYDLRNGSPSLEYDIYAQHVLASGVPDPAWPVDGRVVCNATKGQSSCVLTSDGAGGAIIAWQDFRSATSYDIYAQRVLASGVVDPAWPANGRVVCAATGDQNIPVIVTDGAGGAIVAWQDLRLAGNADLYAQRVLASGVVDPTWPVNGRVVCDATTSQGPLVMISDGAASNPGAILAWVDPRAGANDIYAQHLLLTGVVDAAWPVNGRALCVATGAQSSPGIVTDGSGGAFVSWQDLRGGVTTDIYVQHVLSSGFVDFAWPADGRAVCAATGNQNLPAITTDGAGGAIVAWQDQRTVGNLDVYAQHIGPAGIVDSAWPVDGRAVVATAAAQYNVAITTDGAGGAIVAWQDNRSGSGDDVYSHHVSAAGVLDTTWPTDGRAVGTMTGDQTGIVAMPDGAGGAILAWQDLRNGGVYYDLYAGRVARFGVLGTPEPEILRVRDVPNDNGGLVKVSWNASWLDLSLSANLAAYDVYRSVPSAAAAAARQAGALRTLGEGDLLPLAHQLVAIPAASTAYAWEYVATVNANHFASQYSYLAPTAFDSIGAGNALTAYLVLARNSGGTFFWPSRPDSGYSVDNLPPLTPSPFAANYSAGTTYLHWNRNTELDLAGYRLYRGSSPSFTPSPATRVASPPDTGYADAAGAAYVYKLTAVDSHGNESPVAFAMPTGTTGVEGGVSPRDLELAAASPNPAVTGTLLRFTLPVAANVSLGVYDAAGRQVRSLASGWRAAGEQAIAWDLRDGAGAAVRAGLYFVRLECGDASRVRRVAVTR